MKLLRLLLPPALWHIRQQPGLSIEQASVHFHHRSRPDGGRYLGSDAVRAQHTATRRSCSTAHSELAFRCMNTQPTTANGLWPGRKERPGSIKHQAPTRRAWRGYQPPVRTYPDRTPRLAAIILRVFAWPSHRTAVRQRQDPTAWARWQEGMAWRSPCRAKSRPIRGYILVSGAIPSPCICVQLLLVRIPTVPRFNCPILLDAGTELW
ncbi:hypothetical protein V8C35DRAFT_29710 [Trichoderma chlorosporum]